jgi:hypothetical protein
MLSDDEFTVLMIAAEGQSMMPIGRWQEPVESLVAKGFLKEHDKFNCVITPTGREALRKHDQGLTEKMVALSKQMSKDLFGDKPKKPVDKEPSS